MALSADYEPEQYACNGSTTAFPATWGFFNTTDLIVTLTDSDGDDTILAEGSGAGKYTVTAPNNDYSSGATITTGTTYASGNQITIERSVPEGQDLEIVGDFIPAEPLEQALDKLAAQIQQVGDEVGRTLTIPSTDDPAITTQLPNATTRAGKLASFDALGNATVADPVDSGTILVDDVTIEQDGQTLQVKDGGITTAKLYDGDVTTAKLDDEAVTLAKMADLGDMKVIGNVSGASATPAEVAIIDDDTLATATDTNIPTAESVKAYADALRPKYVAVTGYDSGAVPSDSQTTINTYATAYTLSLLEGTGIDTDRITCIHVRCRMYNQGGTLGNYVQASFPTGNQILLATAHNGAATSMGAEGICQVPVNSDTTSVTLTLEIGATPALACEYEIVGVTQI